MAPSFNSSNAIYIQIKEKIEDQIVGKQFKEEEQIPSTTQMVQFYKVNHITITKGINLLVDEGILYKKRGIGVFVVQGARSKLLDIRKKNFVDDFILPLIHEAEKLGFTEDEIEQMFKIVKDGDLK